MDILIALAQRLVRMTLREGDHRFRTDCRQVVLLNAGIHRIGDYQSIYVDTGHLTAELGLAYDLDGQWSDDDPIDWWFA